MRGDFFCCCYTKKGRFLFSKKGMDMVYLTNTTAAQDVYFPKTLASSDVLSLTLRNTITLEEYALGLHTASPLKRLYYVLSVSLPAGMDEGEYEYTLTSGGRVVGTGVIKIGGGFAQADAYESEINYEQYESE